MPGINGIISARPPQECRKLVTSMTGCMMHERFYISGTHFAPELGVYAGWVACESSFAASQFFFNEDKNIVLIFAGECFADPQMSIGLRQKGHKVETKDGDWLVHLYEEEGDQFFAKLNGLFSGLLIDKRQGKAFLFNDRYGVERIYWHESDESVYFASEAKALLRILPKLREFDERGVAEFLNFGCTLDSRTLFRGIEVLPGASVWSFGDGRCQKGKYFSPGAWEAQAVLSTEEFTTKFQETFNKILPRYFQSQAKIGISLTGGLDTRMIMACRPDSLEKPACYTFSGNATRTMDDRLAQRVARVCGLEHQLLRLESDFFSDFATHADRTIFATDGCFGVTGAHETYLNGKARELTPVRLTGNYGSEILRGISTLKPLGLSPHLFDSRFDPNPLVESGAKGSKNPITFAAFTEVPSSLFGSLAASRSQVRFRTPYLDNEIVALAYQAPEKIRRSSLPAWRLIEANNPSLSKIPTDRGSGERTGPVTTFRRLFFEATFKLDYLNNEGWPNWLSPFEPIFTRVTSSLGIMGLHKYLHYRSWFRRELADYVRDVIADARGRQSPFWNSDVLERMGEDHICGRKNYVREINAVVTLAAVERLLFRAVPAGLRDLKTSEPEIKDREPVLTG